MGWKGERTNAGNKIAKERGKLSKEKEKRKEKHNGMPNGWLVEILRGNARSQQKKRNIYQTKTHYESARTEKS